MAHPKLPIIEAEPHEEKRPAAVVDPEAVRREGMLSWRLSLLDLGAEPAARTVERLREQLGACETHGVGRLITRGRLGPVPVATLAERAYERLEQLQLDDVDELWLLTLADGERLWGIVQGTVFAPVWWTSAEEDLRTRRRRRLAVG